MKKTKKAVKKVKKVDKKKLLEKQCDELWSKVVKIRDGGQCRKCGSIGSSAHHVFGRRHLATRWDTENGIFLCFPHHLHWAHRDIGGFWTWWAFNTPQKTVDRITHLAASIFKPTEDDLLRIKGELECQL